MNDEEVMRELKAFVAKDLLEGKDEGLDADTPLLEWGVIDSMSLVRIVRFMASKFGVEAPAKEIVATNFSSLRAMTAFVAKLRTTKAK